MKKTLTNTLKYFFNALFLVTLCLCNTTNVFACNTTSDDSLPDHEVVDVEYISYNTFIESQISSNTISIEPQSRIKYIIKNLSDTGESLGTTKKVRYGYIVAKPVYDNWQYDVFIDSSRIQESFLTHGTVSKPRVRMRIEKVVVYK